MMLDPQSNKYPFIREMRIEDIPVVQEVEKASHDFPWSEGILRDCILVGYSCWVLEIESGICGFAVMSFSNNEAHLLSLCVHPLEQRKGYGRYMLRFLLTIAKQHGAKTAFLEVRISNQIAIDLYTQFGFKQISVTKDYYPAPDDQREDAIILSLELITRPGWR